MRLQRVARAFDRTPCLDGYTGKWVFNAQLGLYDDTKRDSETGERRILSVGFEATLPARLVVSAAGSRWILGHGNPDTYRGGVIRIGYVAHEATELARVRTLAQACLDQPGFTAWAGRAWIKNSADHEHSSKMWSQFHMHFARGEAVHAERIVSFGTRLLVAREAHEGPAGTLVVMADEMHDPVIEMATVTTGTWNSLPQVWSGSSVAVRVVRTRWQSLFAYKHAAAPKFAAGDIQVAIAKAAATVRAGATLTLSDGTWKVESADDEGDVWLCRAVRHA